MSRIVEDRENYRTLCKILDLLDSVTITPITPQHIMSISFNRLNADFKPFINICSIFLEGSTLTLQASTIETFSLLIPMESLFEQFIAGVIQSEGLYRKVFSDAARIEVQKHIGYLIEKDGKKLAGMRADIVIKTSEEEIIIDTKYKLLNQEDKKLGVSQQDLYQMYAYCKENKNNTKKALLLYPEGLNKIDETNLERPFKFGRDRDIELYVRTISLKDDLTSGSGWESFVDNLKDVLRCLSRSTDDAYTILA